MLPNTNKRATAALSVESANKTDSQIITLPGELRHWEVRCVCGGTHLTCNGGWMKTIEDHMRSIFEPLAHGNKSRLTPWEQKIIATWASIKTVIADYGPNGHVTTHHMQRKYLKAKNEPPKRGWSVWIGCYKRKDWVVEWMSRPLLIISPKQAARRDYKQATYFNSNATTQILGQLFISVIHSPDCRLVEGWRFALPHNGTLFRIWPPSQLSIAWPGRMLNDADAGFAALVFSSTQSARARQVARNHAHSQ
jgi:hypothetical protein